MWKDISSFQLPPLPSYIFSSALLSDQMSLGRIYLIGIIEFRDAKILCKSVGSNALQVCFTNSGIRSPHL